MRYLYRDPPYGLNKIIMQYFVYSTKNDIENTWGLYWFASELHLRVISIWILLIDYGVDSNTTVLLDIIVEQIYFWFGHYRTAMFWRSL